MTARRLLLFAGPNGSGKSTVTTPETLARFGILLERYINADEIARHLATERPDLMQEEREREAFLRARVLRRTYREGGISFAFETVFSHPSTLLDMAKCRAAGFEVVVLFVTTRNPDINIVRVADRVRSGGHDVPQDRIRARYERVMSFLPRIVEESDRAIIYDNSEEVAASFAFVGGKALPTPDPFPEFLRARLLEPLARRRAERRTIDADYGPVSTPDEEGGAHSGAVLYRGVDYVVQETTAGRVRHDCLLLAATPEVGAVWTVSYRDGAGGPG